MRSELSWTNDIKSVDQSLAPVIQTAIDSKTKPLGSLGRIEALAKKICLVQQTAKPTITEPMMIVFAGNHGVTQSGVSAYPSEVTGQMILNFLAGGAAINVLCDSFDIGFEIVNVGVDLEVPMALLSAAYVDAVVATSTKNFALEPAMTIEQCVVAINVGRERAAHHVNTNVFLVGEMGIGNTSSAACITARITGNAIDVCVGRGTGLDDAALNHKAEVLSAALDLHRAVQDPLEVLATFGGFEIAAMVGVILEVATSGRLVVIDGYIATSAALIAHALVPETSDYMVFSHASQEPGHAIALAHLQARELLSLDLRLGEGSGAALAFPLVKAAVNIMRDMATFESASVSASVSESTSTTTSTTIS